MGQYRSCDTCKYRHVYVMEWPCDTCDNSYSLWVEDTEVKKGKTMIFDVDKLYNFVKEQCDGMGFINENYIIRLVGKAGLDALVDENLLEESVAINQERLFVLR